MDAEYSAAVQAASTSESTIITIVANIPLFPRYFEHLHNNIFPRVLHDDLILTYLKLLETTRPDDIKVHTFMVVDKLRQGQYDVIDRCYCGKTIFGYTWHIFPIIRDHQFTLIVLHMKMHSNDMMYFDSYHSTYVDDITVVLL